MQSFRDAYGDVHMAKLMSNFRQFLLKNVYCCNFAFLAGNLAVCLGYYLVSLSIYKGIFLLIPWSWILHVFWRVFDKSWLELRPRSCVPLATLKSKVLPIQQEQDNAGSQKCCL